MQKEKRFYIFKKHGLVLDMVTSILSTTKTKAIKKFVDSPEFLSCDSEKAFICLTFSQYNKHFIPSKIIKK